MPGASLESVLQHIVFELSVATFILVKYVNRTGCCLVIPETMESYYAPQCNGCVLWISFRSWHSIEGTWSLVSVLDQSSGGVHCGHRLCLEFSMAHIFLWISYIANILRESIKQHKYSQKKRKLPPLLNSHYLHITKVKEWITSLLKIEDSVTFALLLHPSSNSETVIQSNLLDGKTISPCRLACIAS